MKNITILAVCLLLVSCSGKKKETLGEKLQKGKLTTTEAFKRGDELMHARKYIDAREWFRIIEAHAPNDRNFAAAKLKIADSYFFDRMSTYIEASVEYKSFLTHFPTHPKADYATYQYAMCFFTEIENADRDQTSTWTAYTEFKNLIDRYPNSPYAQKAKEKIDLCLLRLAEHEFRVGYYYFRRGQGFEKSAESRLKYTIDNYPGQFDTEKVYFYLAETLWRREKYKEAMLYYDLLKREHPDTDYHLFITDKMVRWERIQAGGSDPGELTADSTADPIKDLK